MEYCRCDIDRCKSVFVTIGFMSSFPSLSALPIPLWAARPPRAVYLLPVIDACALLFAFLCGLLVLLMRPVIDWHNFPEWWQDGGVHQFYTFLAFIGIAIHTLWWRGHYNRRKPFWAETGEVVRIVIALALLNGVTVLLAKWPFSRTVWLVGWCMACVAIPLGRLLLKSLLMRLRRWQRPTLVIGSGQLAADACAALQSEPLLGFDIRGFVCLDDLSCDIPPETDLPVFSASAQEVLQWARAHPHAHLVIALESPALEQHAALVAELGFIMPGLHLVPSTAGLPLVGMETQHFFSHDVLLLRARNNLLNPQAIAVKRGFDMVVAALLLLSLSPFFIVVAWLTRRDGGPAFFGQPRVGRNGELFTCYKFRSMRVDADRLLQELLARDPVAREEFDTFRKLKHDPRITGIGHFLRRTSLDELPQLWNVLRGEMSLVGPRPIMTEEMPRFGENLAYYLETRPGMTGLWQVSGRNRLPFQRRVELDAWYVRNWSLWHDLAILLKTVKVVLRREGAY